MIEREFVNEVDLAVKERCKGVESLHPFFGDDVFSWQVESLYQGREVLLGFQMNDVAGCPEYVVYAWPRKTKASVDFIDLEGVRTSNLELVLGVFERYVSFLRNGSVPEKFLPKYLVWNKKQLQGVVCPHGLSEPTLLYSVVEEYELKDRGGQIVEVGKGVHFSGERRASFSVSYDSPSVHELVRVSNGEITSRSSRDLSFRDEEVDASSDESIMRSIERAFIYSEDIVHLQRYIPHFDKLPWGDELKVLRELL